MEKLAPAVMSEPLKFRVDYSVATCLTCFKDVPEGQLLRFGNELVYECKHCVAEWRRNRLSCCREKEKGQRWTSSVPKRVVAIACVDVTDEVKLSRIYTDKGLQFFAISSQVPYDMARDGKFVHESAGSVLLASIVSGVTLTVNGVSKVLDEPLKTLMNFSLGAESLAVYVTCDGRQVGQSIVFEKADVAQNIELYSTDAPLVNKFLLVTDGLDEEAYLVRGDAVQKIVPNTALPLQTVDDLVVHLSPCCTKPDSRMHVWPMSLAMAKIDTERNWRVRRAQELPASRCDVATLLADFSRQEVTSDQKEEVTIETTTLESEALRSTLSAATKFTRLTDHTGGLKWKLSTDQESTSDDGTCILEDDVAKDITKEGAKVSGERSLPVAD